MEEQVVVGDVEAGRAAKIKKEVNRLIKGVSAFVVRSRRSAL